MKSLIKICLITIFLIGIQSPVEAQKGEELFLQGMMKEEGEGKLNEAIKIYTGLVNDNSADRSVRAKALLQMGICYEKLGQKSASTAYEKLISEYADQTELIAVAKRKLRSIKGQLKSDSGGLVSQRIQKSIMSPRLLHRMSPNGRYYCFFESTPGHKNDNTIVVHDLLTDKMTSVSEWVRRNPSSKKNSMAWSTAWSTDSKKLAYSYRNNEEDNVTKQEVHLVNADGSGKKVVYSSSSALFLEVFDFSPDATKVLCRLARTNGPNGLVELNIATGKTQIIKVFEGEVNVDGFQYSPKGTYISYYENDDIFTLNLESGQIEQVTFFEGMDSSPVWSPKEDKILFISDRQGSNDLFYVDMIKGKPSGIPITLKRQLGEGAHIMEMCNDGALYVTASNSRTDIYTVGFSDEFDVLPKSKNRITMPTSDNSNGLARFSNNGKYISYQGKLVKMADGLRSDVNSKYHGYDDELGYKYSINIYNSETNESKLLDIPLYLNHFPRSQAWTIPTWSFHGNQLIVHGRIRENFEGGFFIVDVEKETITPALTKPNCKVGMQWNEVEMGNSMFFSRKKDIIYYSTPGWGKAMKYNIKTGESKELASIEGGFWFDGFSDIEETKIRGRKSSLGDFEYDINTGQIKKLGEAKFGSTRQIFDTKTVGFTMYDLEGNLVFPDVTAQEKFKKVLRLVLDSGEIKEFNLNDLFPEHLVRIEDFQPEKKQLLLSVMKNPGNEIYKISNLFE